MSETRSYCLCHVLPVTQTNSGAVWKRDNPDSECQEVELIGVFFRPAAITTSSHRDANAKRSSRLILNIHNSNSWFGKIQIMTVMAPESLTELLAERCGGVSTVNVKSAVNARYFGFPCFPEPYFPFYIPMGLSHIAKSPSVLKFHDSEIQFLHLVSGWL